MSYVVLAFGTALAIGKGMNANGNLNGEDGAMKTVKCPKKSGNAIGIHECDTCYAIHFCHAYIAACKGKE